MALEENLCTVKKSDDDASEGEQKNKKPKKEKEIKLKKKIKNEDISESESGSDIPSLFKNKIFFLNTGVDKSSDLKRYIRA